MTHFAIYSTQLSYIDSFANQPLTKDENYTLHHCSSFQQLQTIANKLPLRLIYFISKDIDQRKVKQIRNLENLYSDVEICISADPSYAFKAWQLDVFYFTGFPPSDDDIRRVYEKYRKENPSTANKGQLRLKTADGFESIAYKDINFLRASGNYTEINYNENKRKIQAKKLKEFEFICGEKQLIKRVHRSLIVNFRNIQSISDGELIFNEHSKIPISARLEQKLKKEFLLM